MDKRHADFLQSEYAIEIELAAQKQKVSELEQKREMAQQKHELFDKLAQEGPYSRGFDTLMTDPYFNPLPKTPEKAPAKPDAPKPTPQTPAPKPTPQTPSKPQSPEPAPKQTPEQPASPKTPATPKKQPEVVQKTPSNYYSYYYN